MKTPTDALYFSIDFSLKWFKATPAICLCLMLLFSTGALANNAERLEFQSAFSLQRVNTDHFEILYRPRFEWAVDDIAYEAEYAYAKLHELFSNFPDEKIILHIVDSADAPINQTLTAPQPFVRIWVASPGDGNGYGHLKLNNRFRLLVGHELVHLAMGNWRDQSGRIFGRVRSTTNEPMTFPFALLTQSKRFAPLWFHEGAAVLLETWLTNGHGRIVGNLDEAYFRTLVQHNGKVPNWKTIDAETIDEAFNVNGAYFYGARFMSWLTKEYGFEKVIEWLRDYRGASLRTPFGTQYAKIFGQSLDHDWNAFFQNEFEFQKVNISKVTNSSTANHLVAVGETTGLVSTTYFDPQTQDVLFIEIPLHELPRLVRLNPFSGERKILARGAVGSPAFVNVAVTAFDHERRLFYFSQDTGVGWRDLYQVNVDSGAVTKIADNLRQTNLAVEPGTGDLWGTVLLRGESHLARIKRPFSNVELFAKIPMDVSIRDFTFSPDGKSLAAVIQNHSTTQIALLDPEDITKGGSLSIDSLAAYKDPENPTWSPDSKKLYFSSYENGVSNVYVHQVDSGRTFAVSNVSDGLYKPIVVGRVDSAEDDLPQVLSFQLLAGNGFQPVRLTADKHLKLTTIDYLGESVVEKFSQHSKAQNAPALREWKPSSNELVSFSETYDYDAFGSIRLNTLVPVFGQTSSGESAFGAYVESSDVLNHHRFNLGLSTNGDFDRLFWDLGYRYKDFYRASFVKNRSSLYTLVNDPDISPEGWTASVSRRFWYQTDEAGRKILDVGVGYDGNLDDAFINANYTASRTRASITGRRGIENGWNFNINSNLFIDVNEDNVSSRRPSGTIEVSGQVLDTRLAPHNVMSVLVSTGTSLGGDAVGFRINGFPNQSFENRGTNLHRNSAVLPGLDTDSNQPLIAKRFTRIQFQNDFPVARLYKALGSQRVDLLDVRAFGTVLFSDAETISGSNQELDTLYSLGTQVDFRLRHFFNLNSTLSLGYAKVWDENMDSFDEHGFIAWNWFSF